MDITKTDDNLGTIIHSMLLRKVFPLSYVVEEISAADEVQNKVEPMHSLESIVHLEYIRILHVQKELPLLHGVVD